MADVQIEKPMGNGTTDVPSADANVAANEQTAIAAGYTVQHDPSVVGLPNFDPSTFKKLGQTQPTPSTPPTNSAQPQTPNQPTAGLPTFDPSTFKKLGDATPLSKAQSPAPAANTGEAGRPGTMEEAVRAPGIMAPTIYGLDTVAQGTISALHGAASSLNPKPQDDGEKEALKIAGFGGMLVHRMVKGLAPLMDINQLNPWWHASAVHDINQSKDPMGTYLKIAQETAAQGAGQALVALAGEGVVKGAGAAKSAVRSSVAPTETITPAGAHIPVRPETAMGKAAWSGAPEETAKLAQTKTSPAIEKAIGGTVGKAVGSESTTTLTAEDRMGLRGHANDLINNQAKPAYQYIDEASGNKLSEVQDRIDNARGDFSKEGREAFKQAKSDKQDLLNQYRAGAAEKGIDVDAADAAYRKGIAVKKMAAKLDTATGPPAVEGAEHQLNGTRLAKVIDDGIKKGSWKDMGLTDDHISELQKLSEIAKVQTTTLKSGVFMRGLGRAAVFAAGIHGGMLSAIEAATGVSGVDYIGNKIATHIVQDAVMNQEATRALTDDLTKGGNGQLVIKALKKYPSWSEKLQGYAQSVYDKVTSGEEGSAGNVTKRNAGEPGTPSLIGKRGEQATPGNTYEYEHTADAHQVTARNPKGESVALVTAREEAGNPNLRTIHFSSGGHGEGLKAYARLAEATKDEANRIGKPVTLQGDAPDDMSASARRTWVKLGEQHDYDVQWDKDNRPHVTFYPEPKGGLGAEAAIKEGGGTFRGMQQGVPEKGVKGLALFDHPETKSTLALPEDQVTPDAVRARLAAHKADWDAKAKK